MSTINAAEHVCLCKVGKTVRLTNVQLTDELTYHPDGRFVLNGRTYEIVNTRIITTALHLVSLVDVT